MLNLKKNPDRDFDMSMAPDMLAKETDELFCAVVEVLENKCSTLTYQEVVSALLAAEFQTTLTSLLDNHYDEQRADCG